MKTPFKNAVAVTSEAEQSLKTWGIEYEKKPDGTLFVPGDLNISNKGLTRLPDLSSVAVGGNFNCFNNKLTSLEGAPRSVGGDVWCCGNQLTSLEGAPRSVGGDFWCYNNQLITLKHAPQTVGGDFSCSNNPLITLKHAPQTVGSNFYCSDNQLVTLEGAPQTVGDGFYCYNNKLTSLEGAPTTFKELKSDLGAFSAWNAVPEELRIASKTWARLEQDRKAQAETAIYNAVVLQDPVAIKSPLRFKKVSLS